MLKRLLRSAETKVTMGFAILLLVIVVLAPWIAPHDPDAVDFYNQFQPPSAKHVFGTDDVGRDILSRVLVGSRLSLRVAVLAVAFSSVIGIILGAVAGYFGGVMDHVVMRITDMILAFPILMMAMIIAAVLGPSLRNAMIAIIAIRWTSYARVMRAETLDIRENQFVEAARAIGASSGRIILRHILPNAAMTLIVKMSIDVGYAVLWTASLSFLGLGASPAAPEWGMMVANGRPYLFTYWWYPTFPGLAIFLTVLIFGMLGDSLDRALHAVRR